MELLAQQSSGLGNLSPWANLTAVVALIGFLGYILTKFLPRTLDRFDTRMSKTQEEFLRSLHDQRTEFREDLKAHREQSALLASGGHEAVSKLADEIAKLRETMK